MTTAATPTESPVSFDCEGGRVHAILHRPAPGGTERPGVVFCHGWSGDRQGPHRMFVKTARRLAAHGFPCLRLDFRGRGGSEGETAQATIQGMIADTRAAVAELGRLCGVRTFCLVGICSGGKVAIGAALGDRRVGRLILWSAEALGDLRAEATNRRKSFHMLKTYLRKLARPETWRKLLTGRVNVKGVGKAVLQHETRSPAEAAQENAMLADFRRWRGEILFIYGGNDPDTRLAGANYQAFCRACGIAGEFHEIAEANHSFYSLAWEREVIERSVGWLAKHTGSSPA